jgi:hypothetical protein
MYFFGWADMKRITHKLLPLFHTLVLPLFHTLVVLLFHTLVVLLFHI